MTGSPIEKLATDKETWLMEVQDKHLLTAFVAKSTNDAERWDNVSRSGSDRDANGAESKPQAISRLFCNGRQLELGCSGDRRGTSVGENTLCKVSIAHCSELSKGRIPGNSAVIS